MDTLSPPRRNPVPAKPLLAVAIPFAALAIAACAQAPSGPVSLEQASQRVLDEVLRPQPSQRGVIVFGRSEPLQPGDQIHPYQKEGHGPFSEPTVIQEETWFFWIDEAPGALFAHPNRFVFVTIEAGALSVSKEEWWPVLNGEGLWVEADEYWDEANWIFSDREEPPPSSAASRSPGAARPRRPIREPQAGSPGSAIVINGWDPGETLQDNLAESADQMHDMLTDAGFDTTYLGPAEDTNPDRDGEPTVEGRVGWFFDKAREMQPSQTLFVYVGAHGSVSEDGSGNLGPVSEGFLKNSLGDFDPGVHIIVVLDGCHSGAFTDGLAMVADITITSTDSTSPAYADVDSWYFQSDSNSDDEGLEYTSGFVEDWREIMADPAARQRVEERAEREGVNFWEAIAPESHLTAVEKDFAFQLGWTGPLLVRGQPQTRPGPTATPTLTPTPQPTRGTVDAQVSVGSDPAGHDPFVGMPGEVELEWFVEPDFFTISGPFPWVTVTGLPPDEDGSFFLMGIGDVAGFPKVAVEFSGTFTPTHLIGDYEMGAEGRLPSGRSIIYGVEGDVLVPIVAPPTSTPLPPEPTDPAVFQFYDSFNLSFQNQDPDALFDSLHPAVIDLYGAPACQSYLEGVIDNPVQVEVLAVTEFGLWTWEIDGRSTLIPDAFTIDVDVTAGGQTTMTTTHLAERGDGSLGWFTDCGDPPP